MGQIISHEHDFSPNQPVIPEIISVIAEAEGRDPTALTPPLYDVLDPEALEMLVQDSTASVCVHFEYRGRSITVRSDGIISVSGNSDQNSLYQYECHTCDEEGLFDSRERAQAVFSEHAEQLHEVVFRRVESPTGNPITEVRDGDSTSESSTQAPEPRDGQPADG